MEAFNFEFPFCRVYKMKGYFRYYEDAMNNVWVPLASEVFGLNIYDCCDEYDIIKPLVKIEVGFQFNFAHF